MAEKGFVLMDGANQLFGLRSMFWVLRRWRSLRNELCSAPGYISHRIWFVPPLTIGLTTWWENENSAYGFAHLPVHLQFWDWGANPKHTRGGWLAAYKYVHGGPLWGNGVQSMAKVFSGLVPDQNGKPAKKPPQKSPR